MFRSCCSVLFLSALRNNHISGPPMTATTMALIGSISLGAIRAVTGERLVDFVKTQVAVVGVGSS